MVNGLPHHPQTGCTCAEGRVTTVQGALVQFLPPVHDCAYIAARNALIPMAEQAADLMYDRAADGTAWGKQFTAVMDRLWRERAR